MAVIYRVNRAKLTDGLRLEAEFYQPKYLFGVSSHCKWVRIGTILSFCQYGSSLPLNEEGKGYPIFRLNEINDCFLTKPQKWVVMSQREYRMLKLQRDDVLFCRTNGNFELVGRTGILKEDVDAVFASYLVRVRTNPQYILPEFLTIYLNTTFGKLQIQRRAMRSNQVNVSASQLKAIPIPIFTHEFQTKVADFVNHAADKVLLSKHNYSQAEQLLLSELGLHDWKPRHTLTYVRSFSQVKQANRMDAEHFQPKYEEVLARIHQYSPKPITSFGSQVLETIKLDENKIYRYIEISDVNTATGEVEFTERVAKELPANAKIKVEGGELVVSKVRPTRGAIGVIPNECRDNGVCSNAFVVLKIPSPEREFLQVYLRSTIGKTLLEKPCKGTSYPTINDNDVKLLPVPTIAQSKIEQISHLVQQSHTARRESKTLLEKAKRAVEIAIEEGEEQAMEFLSR